MTRAISRCLLLLAFVICVFAPALAQTTPTISFAASSYAAREGAGGVEVAVMRSGDTASAVTVDYATSSGTASERTDFIPALGTLRFAAGETTKTFKVLIIDNFTPESDETIDLMLFNPTGGAALSAPDAAVVTINDDDGAPSSVNPVDDSRFFVRQHYCDFLGREPDQAGLDFWTNQIESCGADAQCREVKRINVSAAFFLSIEFQETGYFVRRLYQFYFASRWPIWREFMRDVQEVGRGVVVGEPGWEERLEANKRAFIEDWYNRHRLVLESQISASKPITDAQYVDGLFRKISITPSETERQALLDGLSAGTETRASVLRKIADNPEFVRREFVPAFVIMQYFGYLRREPDSAGFDFWVNKLNQFGGNFVDAEMVKAFITSGEYRDRFTHSDALPEAFFEIGDKTSPKTFVFKLSDPARIAEARSLIGGRNLWTSGIVTKERIYYNRAWHYHLAPGSIGFADFTVEACQTGVIPVENGLEEVGGSFLSGNVMCVSAQVLRELPPPPR